MKRKPHICCSSSSFQHGAHPGLGTEDALVQYPSFVGVLQCFSSLWRQFLIRDTLGAGSPLLGFGHFCLLSSWHSVWRGIKSIWNVWNMAIKIAETNLVHQNIGPSFGQSDCLIQTSSKAGVIIIIYQHERYLFTLKSFLSTKHHSGDHTNCLFCFVYWHRHLALQFQLEKPHTLISERKALQIGCSSEHILWHCAWIQFSKIPWWRQWRLALPKQRGC